FLFMGRAELLLTHGDLFTPVELKWRVFTKTVSQNMRAAPALPEREEETATMPNDDRLQIMSLETDPVARIVVRAAGTLGFATGRARALFRMTQADVGKRVQDLEMSYRPVELRSMIQDAMTQHRTVTRKDIPWPNDTGDPRYVDLDVAPLVDTHGETLGVPDSFSDMRRSCHLHDELKR